MKAFRYKQNRLQLLRGFCAVLETRSVSKAAERLHLTQPTISLQVQALERDLRTRLFERRGPRIEPTPEGELLYDLARPLVEGLGELDLEASQVVVALRICFGSQRGEAFWQSVNDPDELDRQPGLIIFSGRTHSSNSSLVR